MTRIRYTNTGIRLQDKHFDKLDLLRDATGLRSRNAVVVQLIETAALIERHEVIVSLELGIPTLEATHAQ